jgi:hypothetical protein
MRLAAGLDREVLHSSDSLLVNCSQSSEEPVFSLQAIEFIGKYSAFFLIEVLKQRMNT